MQPCFTTSVCAIAFSPDGSILLAVGTSSGDQHTLVAFDWASGKVLAKSVAMTARSRAASSTCSSTSRSLRR